MAGNEACLPRSELREENHMSIRVLIADHHYFVRVGLQAALGIHDDVVIAGEATTCAEVIALCDQARPDVVLMDAHLPGEDSIETIAHLASHYPHICVIALIDAHDIATLRKAVQAGARGYISRISNDEALADTIRRAYSGLPLLPPEFTETLLSATHITLTEREREVLALVIQGLTNQQIASLLNMSKHTAQFHVRNIRAKLGAKNRAEAGAIAIQLGLVEPPQT